MRIIARGANAFVFYGLSVNAVNLSGNIYFNFILGSLSEMLGNFISHVRSSTKFQNFAH